MTDQIAVMKAQPPALKILFFSEMWERFSFYGIKALLILYITQHLHLSDSTAYGILGAYATLLYASFIMGGYLTDKFLGYKSAIIFGAILITMGHFSLAVGDGLIFYLGLSFIIIGTGFFKGNITSFLGKFYEDHDPRRDAGFTIFYMGINIGGLIAPILCGYLANRYSWHLGFSAAGVGMLLGLVIFCSGTKTFEGQGASKTSNNLIKYGIYFGMILLVPIIASIIQNHHLMSKALPVIGVVTLLYLIQVAIKSNPIERANILTLGLMMIFVLIFLAFWEQAASSLTIFTERYVNRDISFLSIPHFNEIPTPWIHALNPFFVLLVAPLLSLFWESCAKAQRKIYSPYKFAIGFVLLSLGFIAFKQAAISASINGKSNLIWIILGYFFYTTGELAILPIGYAMVTKLAPSDKSSAFMGIWFMGFAFAQHIASLIAKLTASSAGSEGTVNVTLFSQLFHQISYFSMATALVIFVVSGFVLQVFKRVE